MQGWWDRTSAKDINLDFYAVEDFKDAGKWGEDGLLYYWYSAKFGVSFANVNIVYVDSQVTVLDIHMNLRRISNWISLGYILLSQNNT